MDRLLNLTQMKGLFMMQPKDSGATWEKQKNYLPEVFSAFSSPLLLLRQLFDWIIKKNNNND